MLMQRVLGGILIAAAIPASSLSAQAAAAPAPMSAAAPVLLTDAREQAPAGLIGLWKVDIAASTYKTPKPQAAIRSFAYTEDGRILVSFSSFTAKGVVVSGHWAAQIDGTPAIEYHSSAGSVPFNVVTLRKIDDKTLNLTVTRHGKVSLQASYTLSPDGKTLTYRYDQDVIVYRPWNLMD